MGFSLDLLGEVNNRFEMNIFGLLDFLYVSSKQVLGVETSE